MKWKKICKTIGVYLEGRLSSRGARNNSSRSRNYNSTDQKNKPEYCAMGILSI
jgi:hypothetical protein